MSRPLAVVSVLLAISWLVTGTGAQGAAAWSSRVLQQEDVAESDALGDIFENVAPGPLAEALASANATEKKTIAQLIDEALEQEFPEETSEGIGKNYNETAKNADAKLETVLKVSSNRKDEEEEEEEESTNPVDGETSLLGTDSGAADPKPKKEKKDKHRDVPVEAEIDRIIDAQDNEYILSKPKDGTLGLTLDPQLIRDLTVLITSSTAMGMILESLHQPVINGYLIAGSIVGPGGLQLIKELVQVESLAQVGVQLLLFTLGLEFSLSKLRAVRNVALFGGTLQVVLTMILAGGVASAIGASIHEGVFVGALVAMSSTSIVIKCLSDAHQNGTPHGQITIGTLILQDCMVGLLFAFMPVLAHRSGGDVEGHLVARLLFKVTASLGLSLACAVVITRTVLPKAARLLAQHATDELYQLTIIAFCLVGSWISGHLGLSTELGAFVAGVMLSATDQQEHALHQLEQVKGFFMSLFIASTGLVMSPRFLAAHLPVLTAGVFLVVLGKSLMISLVVWLFQYPPRTALAVGLGMAQIGEFAFVLLSTASQLGLLQYQVYMLLMGVTGLSLLITPFIMQLSTRYLHLEGDDPKLFRAVRGGGRHSSGGGGASDVEGAMPNGHDDSMAGDSPLANGNDHARHRAAKGRVPANGEVLMTQRGPFL